MADGPISEVMSTRVERVSPRAPLAEVVERMRRCRVSCVVVCEDDRAVGIISERDLLRMFTDHATELRPVERARDLMSSPVVTVDRDAAVQDGVATIQRHGIRRLVAVDSSGAIAGVVTQTDLMRAYITQVERHCEDLDRQVRERTLELEESNLRLQSLSRMDSLMDIGNRRAMEVALDSTHDRARRYGTHYSLALLDVDHFKAYNDAYGHQAGDESLRRVARAIDARLRASDELFRYGGEEVLMLLPETSLGKATEAVERARGIVEALGIEHGYARGGILTISAGVSTLGRYGDRVEPCWKNVVARADAALYEAKGAGRNRVVQGPFRGDPEANWAQEAGA